MNRNELIAYLAAEIGASKKLVRELFSELQATAIRELKSKGVFSIPGLGKLFRLHRRALRGRNPRAGEAITLPAKTVVKFHVDRKAKDSIATRGRLSRPGGGRTTRSNFKGRRIVSKHGGPKGTSFRRGYWRGRHKLLPVPKPPTHRAKPLPVPKLSEYWRAEKLYIDIPTFASGGIPKPLPAPAQGTKPEANYSIQRVFFATDRDLSSTNPPRFGHKRNPAGTLTLGTCDVSIPRDPRHHTARIERPSIWRFEFREDPEKHFTIRERTIKPRNEFYEELAALVAKSENKEAFVFIHGFRVAFDDAVYRTAQITYDLGFPGAPVLYSWPSNGKLYEYMADINNNDWTMPHLQDFLLDFCRQSGARTVHLIAHSMGNRVLCNALNQLATKTASVPMPLFNQVVLTAPDIDADVFIQLSAAVKMVASRVTLYASTRDKALLASRRINGSYPRAGDCSKAAVVVAGVDTIDASAVDTNLIGHFYYGDNRSVLSDIFNLLKDGSPPSRRFGIRAVGKVPPYWSFRP